MECPRTEMFQLLFGGQLTPEQQGPLADHAATCPACHAVVETLLTQAGGAQTAERPMTVGSIVGGRFRIDQLLGAGGMGIVVAATHLELGNRVAIKFMRDDKLEAVAIERVIREARAVVKLRTEHVCRVYDVARLDTGAPYIVMELLEGVDLGRTVAARPLPATIAVEYVMQAMVGLAEAHAHGIVHRDLKPANLFVTRRQDGGPLVKVLDFGIAKALDESDSRLTRTRVMLGSPGYISPEQLDSPRDVDARTDIWALGVTLYQLLSGRLPFWGRNQTEIAVKIAAEAPPPLEADPRLAAVVMRCLEKSCDDRYPDVATLAAELVPFGGPRARKIAAAVAKAAQATTGSQPVIPTPSPLPAVSLHAPTAATGASATGASAVVAAASVRTKRGSAGAIAAAPLTPAQHAAPAMPIATTPGVQPAAAIPATPVRARRGSAGAVMAAAPAPAIAEVTAANSAAMTVAVSRPLEIARLADGRLADARVADASALAAGSGAAHPQRARRWQLAVAGVIGLVAAATITIAVRGLATRDDGAAAPGSAVAVTAPPSGAAGAAPAAAAPGAGSPGASIVAPRPPATGPAPAAPSPSVPSPSVPSHPGASSPAPMPGASPASPSRPGASPSAPRAVAPSPTGPSHPAASPAAPHATRPPLLPPHIATSPTAPRGATAAPGKPAVPGKHAAPGKRAPPADALGSAPMPLSSLDAELKQSCDATLAPATAASVKPTTIVTCWCQPRDEAHARQAYGLLSNPHDRDAVKLACAKQGIALP